jgi:hypothetical protein
MLGNMGASLLTGGNLGANSTATAGVGTAAGGVIGGLIGTFALPFIGTYLGAMIGGGLGGFIGSFAGGETETQKHDREQLDAQKKAIETMAENTKQMDLLSQTYGTIRDITSQNLITMPSSAYFSGRYAPAIAQEASNARQKFVLEATFQANIDGKAVWNSQQKYAAESGNKAKSRGL